MEDLISKSAVIGKLSQGYWDRELQQAKNDPCVIDAMIDWAIRQVKDVPIYNPWHTRTPTEGGLYFVYEKYVGYAERDLPTNISKKDLGDSFYNVIAWQKIEPYEGRIEK